MTNTPTDERIAIIAQFANGLIDAPAALTALAEAAEKGDAVAQSVIDHLSDVEPARPTEADEPVLLLEQPVTYLRQRVLHPIECAYLIATSSAGLFPSYVLTKEGNTVDLNHRRSMNRALEEQALDDAERLILNKAADRAGLVRGLRDRNIVRYSQGDVFRAHFDSIAPNEHNREGVRRSHTNIIYLNDSYSGGETAFVNVGMAFKGKVGDLIQFCNELPDGSRDKASFHAGLPINFGEKWILVQWKS